MGSKSTPPHATIRRLSVYLRCLNLFTEKGVTVVSSKELAERLDLNPAQVRKDLACFGEFGKRGVGYPVAILRTHLVKILGLQKRRLVGIVGAGGRLGQALGLYKGFEKRNFDIVAAFDIDPNVLHQPLGNAGEILSISELLKIVKERNIEILILTVPADVAREVFDFVLLSGVKAVLNFAPVNLLSTDEVSVRNVDMSIELESLSYHLSLHDCDISDT